MKGYKIKTLEIKNGIGDTFKAIHKIDGVAIQITGNGLFAGMTLNRKDRDDLMDWLAMVSGHTNGLYDKVGNEVVEPRQFMEFEPVLSCCGDDMTGLDVPICPTCKEWQ
jgi:hypothetical protein